MIIDDYEYESIDKRLGLKEDFDKINIEDLTEQNFARNSVKSPMCFTNIHHLNFIQLIALAQAPYLNNENEITIAKDSHHKDTIFKGLTIEKMEFLTKDNGNIVLLRTDIKSPNSDKELIVFSVRGSVSFKDWWVNLEMYSPSAIFTIIKMIPLIQKEESLTSKTLNLLLTFPLNVLEEITLLNHYSKTAYDKIDPIIKDNKNKDILFVGHSLGGGLSKYLATHYNKQSFSVSGPGITPLQYKYSEISGYNEYFKSNFIDVIPDNDIVPRLEISGGIKYRVLCKKNLGKCHSIDRTLCMVGIICEQEEYTKKLCLSMPNIGQEEYDEMKKLKNGDKFCNNYILKDSNEKDICKSAEKTSSDYKCCYIHLQYSSKNEYKCLQFYTDEEKTTYQTKFLNKYEGSQIEIDCFDS